MEAVVYSICVDYDRGLLFLLPVYRFEIPTPYEVGPVNTYLIPARPYTIIDPGPDFPAGKQMLESSLAEIGLRPVDVERVIITHYHPDHSGLASWINSQSGAKIYVHPYEMRKLSGNYDFVGERISFIREAGMPESILAKVLQDKDALPRPYVDSKSAVLVKGGEQLELNDGVLSVGLFPGHAPGHICLFYPESGDFFSGDFLLPNITPNPFMEPDPEQPDRRTPSLRHYIEGLNRLKQMNIKKVWPGHGEVINDYRSVVDANLQHHERRCASLLDILRQGGEMSAYQLSRVMYPRLQGFQIFMGLSEVQAHLDVTQDRGQVDSAKIKGIYLYKAI